MFDASTLFIVLIGICVLTAVALGAQWVRMGPARHLLCWALAFLMGSAGLALAALRGSISDFLSIDIANALVLAAPGVGRSGVRIFDGRSPRWWPALVFPALWLAACRVPAIYDSFAHRAAVASLLAMVASLMLADAIWRRAPDRLAARGPMAALCLLHGVTQGIRAIYSIVDPSASGFQDTFATIILLELIFVLFGVTILGLGISRERTELELRERASTDSLTGLLNRGAFVERAEALLQRARREGRDAALLVFDLDRFKELNDRYGHAGGDDTLRRFAAVARSLLRPSDPIGRIGGEEFAAVLVGLDAAAGTAVAERIRREFSRRPIETASGPIRVTVSIGVATTNAGDFAALMARADAALYAAKRDGRDIVRAAAS